MISIVIPVFNAEKTLKETLCSVLESGLNTQEIVIVDDGSTDNSLDIAYQFRDKNKTSDIKILPKFINEGGGAARNLGIENSSNPYIFVLDSDDILVPNSLKTGLDEMLSNNVDAVATKFASFFEESINNPVRTYDYPQKKFSFIDLISHEPNPVIGNLLFKKSAYDLVGGYPEKHGFDTQGFGFRLLRNNVNVFVGSSFFYHQRLPKKPSYYIREARAGNINKNWFFILTESLYKFDQITRTFILEYDYSNPKELAKGNYIFDILATMTEKSNIFNKDAIHLKDSDAYEIYKGSDDLTFQAWCIFYEFRCGLYQDGIQRYIRIKDNLRNKRVLYTLLAELIGTKIDSVELEEFIYFFSNKKSKKWKMSNIFQRVKQKILLGRK